MYNTINIPFNSVDDSHCDSGLITNRGIILHTELDIDVKIGHSLFSIRREKKNLLIELFHGVWFKSWVSYDFWAIPDFHNISVREENYFWQVTVTRKGSPLLTLVDFHPSLCEQFVQFFGLTLSNKVVMHHKFTQTNLWF